MQSALNAPHLINEEAAFAYVEAKLWANGTVCPHCGVVGESTKSQGKTTRMGLWNCRGCRKPFTVRMGTIFESSHVPLHIWLQVIYLVCSSKKGISTRQIQRTIGGSMKTAWFLGHRIREAMTEANPPIMGGGGGIIEADETFLGQQATQFISGEGWRTKRGTGDMRKIVSVVERGGRVRSMKVDNLRKEEITRAMDMAARDSILSTDAAHHYRRIGREFIGHMTVDHGSGEYGRGEAHTNTIEGVFSIFKRGMRGIYQHCSEKHLSRYLAEFDFRYSNRIKLGVDDKRRADIALAGFAGKRLTYETVSERRRGQEGRIVW
ncbi:MAG TPA: IS1595 family transposase [Caulobacteraceae bacterium]|nr:IS1595 family transposase [Caulobacteraceae bacterium]